MTAVLQRAHVSVEDYLNGEIHAEVKHEYLGGDVHAMAGATVRHNRIVSSVMLSFGNALRGRPCEVFNSDMKVRIELAHQTRFYYPDAMVVCDSNSDFNYFQDRPVVIVEVLSDSTRRIDLGEKRDAYLTIPSLKLLIFIEPGQPAVLVYRRQPSGGFLSEEYLGLEAKISLPEIGVDLSLSDLYDRLEF